MPLFSNVQINLLLKCLETFYLHQLFFATMVAQMNQFFYIVFEKKKPKIIILKITILFVSSLRTPK